MIWTILAWGGWWLLGVWMAVGFINASVRKEKELKGAAYYEENKNS